MGLSFDETAEAFIYVNAGGPTSYTLELSTVDSTGRPVRFAAPPATAGPGGTLTFKPDWNHPGVGTGIITARTADGEVTNTAL